MRRKPTTLKLLHGSHEGGLQNKVRARLRPAKVAPPCPAFLDEAARKEWRRLEPELVRLGLLTELDQAQFASYCMAVSRWKRAEKALVVALTRMTPSGRRVAKVQLAIAKSEREMVHKLAQEFGLSPAARSRLNSNPEAVTPGGVAGVDLTLGGLLDYDNWPESRP